MTEKFKVIVSCAITGAIHTPSMTPHLPVTADAIVEQAIGAAKAGAAILHLLPRTEADGRPAQSVEGFLRILPPIAAATNAVINVTTGGSPYMTVAERVESARRFAPELASLNMGSINFGLYPLLGKYKTFKHEWERAHLENSRDLVFRNSFKDIEFILDACRDNGTRFEFECYDIAHLYNLAHFADRGLVKPPFFVQSIFGLLGAIGTHEEDVTHMHRTATRLFGSDYRWSVLGAGKAQMRIGAIALAYGGNVRVGLEDSIWAGPGRLATSNAEQVGIIRAIVESMGLELATPDEARTVLGLKGRAATAIPAAGQGVGHPV
ncbi:MAG TPA: 3-keto-5-aminohexanoate cleavage protein [Rhizobiaceae bacterium]|nr:3-keto-5-aminohexanoate cleavage protein [Rhizobiaceae bacterium]